jgi:predicted NUDIX family NTP pyrophosphohydrolase
VPRKQSAGVLVYRRGDGIEVLLVHPGGPFWSKKDVGAWSIPKGEVEAGEDPQAVARRELHEETGFRFEGGLADLSEIRQPGGKLVHAWAAEGDFDVTRFRSNSFTMEWPPKSGRMQQFPEVDRAAWFSIAEARRRILAGQVEFLGRLEKLLGS